MYKTLANFVLGGKEYKIGDIIESKIFNDVGVLNFFVQNGTLEKISENVKKEPQITKKSKK